MNERMKAGTSSLNPYAASYVPISRRGEVDGRKSNESTAINSNIGSPAGFYPGNASQNQHQRFASPPQSPNSLKLKNPSSQSAELAGKQALDVDIDMNLAYLQMTFPDVSDESLFSVYTANRGDMEATIDMLSQLEAYSVDFSEKLPDTLDIGDVSEAGTSGEGGSKTVVGGGDNIHGGSWAHPRSSN